MALCRLALVLLAGCDGLFRLGEVKLDPTMQDGGTQDVASNCIAERFDGTPLLRWDRKSDPGCLPTFLNEEVQMPLPANAACFAYLTRRMKVSMVGASVEVKAIELPTATENAEAWLSLVLDETNYYEMYYNPTNLSPAVVVDDTNLHQVDVTYEPSVHRYWRIEHRPNATPAPTIAFRVSPDGVMWNDINEIPVALPLDSLTIELGTGAYSGGVPTEQLSRFDDVIYCTP